jgi:hypothetical protein
MGRSNLGWSFDKKPLAGYEQRTHFATQTQTPAITYVEANRRGLSGQTAGPSPPYFCRANRRRVRDGSDNASPVASKKKLAWVGACVALLASHAPCILFAALIVAGGVGQDHCSVYDCWSVSR